jgi:spore germination protein YaaH
MVRRNPARYLAPLALAATITGTYLIVHASLATKKHTTATQARRPVARPRGRFARRRFYTVQAGDNLSSIASKTGVPVATLTALNRIVDPTALQPGQRLRLRR